MPKTILITGSTDGIGKNLAMKLASEGHEVILHGRNSEKLRVALSDIQLKTGNKKNSRLPCRFFQVGRCLSFQPKD